MEEKRRKRTKNVEINADTQFAVGQLFEKLSSETMVNKHFSCLIVETSTLHIAISQYVVLTKTPGLQVWCPVEVVKVQTDGIKIKYIGWCNTPYADKRNTRNVKHQKKMFFSFLRLGGELE